MRGRVILILLIGYSCLYSQRIAPDTYWVYFTDKDNSGFEISKPEEFLSIRSINRRGWQGLSIDISDMPVNHNYVDILKNEGLEVVHVSRWLNGAAIRSSNPDILETLYAKSFIDSIQWNPADDSKYYPASPSTKRFEGPLSQSPDFDYGYSIEQIELIGLKVLHQKGFTGKGVHIAVLDAGFKNVDSVPSFEKMISEGRILDTLNFVNDAGMFRINSSHGMSVLSIMGAEWNSNIIGAAPHANYLLCMTENPFSEYRIEEISWIEAAELADSLGFDVINTSLGYSVFDDSTMNYTYEDMDGESTYISRAASMLSGKGMIAVNSAGNSGSSPWHYITAPADAKNIISVGAVDSLRNLAGFSSRGPSYDNRIKPDVVGMGSRTAVQHYTGVPVRGSGTSYSSPVIAGSVAVLWQAYPDMPAEELIKSVLFSSDQHSNPDKDFGYGLPNFAVAYYSINSKPDYLSSSNLDIYPNPADNWIMIKIPESTNDIYNLECFDMQGRLNFKQEIVLPGKVILPGSLLPGFYILQIRTQTGIYRTRLIKN